MTNRKKLAEQANAVHEAGHAVSMWFESILPGVKMVSIVPLEGSLGRTRLKTKSWVTSLSSKDLVRAEIRTFMAGRIAEELCLGEPFVGASDDIEKATALAMMLVAQEGMKDEFGSVCLGQTAGSEHVRKQVDLAIVGILSECRKEALKKLRPRKQDILKVAFALIERKTLKTKHLKKILGPRPKWRPKRGLLKRRETKSARRK